MPIYYLHNAGYKYAIPSNEKDFVTSHRGQNIVDMVFHDNTVETNAIIVGLDVDDHNPVHITFQKNKVEQVLQDNIINNDFIDEQYKLFYDYYLQKPKFVFANANHTPIPGNKLDSHITGFAEQGLRDSHITGFAEQVPIDSHITGFAKVVPIDSHITGFAKVTEQVEQSEHNNTGINNPDSYQDNATKMQLLLRIAEIHDKNKHIKNYAIKHKDKSLLFPLVTINKDSISSAAFGYPNKTMTKLLDNKQVVINYKSMVQDFLDETSMDFYRAIKNTKRLDDHTEIYYHINHQ
jgi:hypothetical protein